MSSNNDRPLRKRVIVWLLLSIAGAIVGSFVTFALAHYIYPFWAKTISFVVGKRCCYKPRDLLRVETFANKMTDLIKTGYVITVSPQSSDVKIAHGEYECQKSYLEVTKHVLDRNSGNLEYTIDAAKKVIHITVKRQ